jgi:hypothetical protein
MSSKGVAESTFGDSCRIVALVGFGLELIRAAELSFVMHSRIGK